MGSIGMPELIVVFFIALIVFGPRKLPELGRALGQTMNEFKKGMNNIRDTIEEEARKEEPPPPAQPAADDEAHRHIS